MFQSVTMNGLSKHVEHFELINFQFPESVFILRGKSHDLFKENPLTMLTKTFSKRSFAPQQTLIVWALILFVRQAMANGCRTLTGLPEPVKGKSYELDQL